MVAYAKNLKTYARIGDMGGWYGHLIGGWRPAGSNLESDPYIKDEDGNCYGARVQSVRDGGYIFLLVLNESSATIDISGIKSITQLCYLEVSQI